MSVIWMRLLKLPLHTVDNDNLQLPLKEVLIFPKQNFLLALVIVAGFALMVVPFAWAGVLGARLFGSSESSVVSAMVVLLGIGLGQIALGTALRNIQPVKLLKIILPLMVMMYMSMLLVNNLILLCIILSFISVLSGMVQSATIVLCENILMQPSFVSIALLGFWGESGASIIYYLIWFVSALSSDPFMFVYLFCGIMLLLIVFLFSSIKYVNT